MSVSNMESLLDFEKPLDVGLLDVVVTGFYTCSNETGKSWFFLNFLPLLPERSRSRLSPQRKFRVLSQGRF